MGAYKSEIETTREIQREHLRKELKGHVVGLTALKLDAPSGSDLRHSLGAALSALEDAYHAVADPSPLVLKGGA